jgi:hypothetical protein
MAKRTGIDLLREYESGQRLRHGDVNAMIAFMQRNPGMLSTELISNKIQNIGETGKNVSGGSATAGAVVMPTAFSPLEGKRGWEFDQPASGMPQAKLVIDISRDVADDGQVACQWAWKGAWCLYTGTDPVLFDRWGVTAASWALTKGMTGDFLAMGSHLTIGSNKFGLFVQILGHPVIAVTNEDIAHGASGEVEQLEYSSGWQRTGNTFDAYDVFLNTGETLDADTIVRVQDYGVPTIDAMYCVANDWL